MFKFTKKHIALFLVLTMALSLVGCGKDKAPTSSNKGEGKFVPGVYTGEAKGISDTLTLEVEVDEENILSVKILNHSETPGISDTAIDRIPKEIVEYQSLNIDTISGATVSSTAILEAAKQALEKAGANIDDLLKEVDKSSSNGEVIEKTTDVVIVGGGGAGLAAAVSALQNNAKVIVLEKMPTLGGSTIMAGGQYNAVDSKRQEALTMRPELIKQIEGITKEEPVNEIHKRLMSELAEQIKEYKKNKSTYMFDSPQLHALQAFNGGDKKGNLELIEKFAYGAKESVGWLEGLGVKISDEIATVTGALWPRTHQFIKPLTTGPIDAYVEFISSKGDDAEIILETKITDIIMKDGKAVGVKGLQGNNEIIVNANKGVIIATGGFARNKELVAKYDELWGDLSSLNSTNSVSATGDGIVMADAIGASLVGMEYIQLLPVGHPETGGMSGNISINAANQLFINNKGERFVAEDSRRDTLTKGLLEQPDQIMWILHDAHEYYNEDVKNDFNESIGKLVESGIAVKGNTIEELAEQMKVDPATLKNTVDTYNKAVRGEISDPLGKNLLQDEFNKAPFYASVRVPTIHHTMGGIEINTDAQVVDKNGNIIKGLYAAGEVTGGIHGSNRLGGNAIPDTVVYGKIAGESAALEK
ncbi:flavocytochrome c [Tissierella praeacuta]|uniref:flavocytochrome c n=1 Tax=Tissierella praeacuta TaxID=43131 RepID=UPI0028AC5F02|nr:flavocytochrome c [Tissierella praeacuta]